MATWTLDDKNLKRYPHFDSMISSSAAVAYASSAENVTHHQFYPFIRFTQGWNRFAKKGEKGRPKTRPIRYAARRDAYIFSRYRHDLSEKYEIELTRVGLGDSILAYRRLKTSGGAGKCNIHFAADAFKKIRDLKNCAVIAADISGYFEALDHAILKALWCRLLGVAKLPPDHFQVFKAITKYAVVDKVKVYTRLGHFGVKRRTPSGYEIKGYLTPFDDVPKQLCRGKEFQQKIAGGGAQRSIIEKNTKPYGIPQGAPISDLLANIYLLDFDAQFAGIVTSLGGSYFRYSDDILVVVPGDDVVARALYDQLRSLIATFGSEVRIKDEKSTVYVYAADGGDDQRFSQVLGDQGKNGLEYLGFRYDGRRVFIRDSTISNLRRKVARAARRDAESVARRYSDKGPAALKKLFNYERLVKQFGRVEGFKEVHNDYRKWTFWTYARRAAEIFGPLGTPILRQLRRHQALIRRRADKEIDAAFARREKRRAK